MDNYEKKYKEALERARKELNTCGSQDCDAARQIFRLFPELAESEDKDNKRISKEITQFIKQNNGWNREWLSWLEKQGEHKQEINNFDIIPGLYRCVHRMFDGTPESRLLFEVGEVYRCLSKHDRAEFEVSYGHSVYLEDPVVRKHFIPFEKQGEQKNPIIDFKAKDWYVSKVDGKIHNIYHSVDMVETKFKEDEWITNGDHTWKIVEVKSLDYILQSQDGDIIDDAISYVDEQFHSFTIEDVKDGDVLQLGEVTAIFKEYIGQEKCICYCSFSEDGGFEIPIKNGDDNVYGCYESIPATKEQRDILFKKMKDAGYEWDAEKKELKLLITNGGDFGLESCEQNSAWSEEDENILEDVEEAVINYWHGDTVDMITSWLKRRIKKDGNTSFQS